MENNDTQISVFLLVKKAPIPGKKHSFEKKSFQLICADNKVFKTVCDFFEK